MTRPSFLSFSRESIRRKPRTDKSRQLHVVPWIASPLEVTNGSIHLRRRSEASPIELFYDLFLVANLATFSATREINNMRTIWSYFGFLGVIWFTWLQVTLFDIRFAKDSILERICKAVQLAAMVGFASAGSRFSTHISSENIWAFQSLSILLSGSRVMLALQYTVNLAFIHNKMQSAIKGMCVIIAVLTTTGLAYLTLYFAFGHSEPHVWTVWYALFLVESLVVMGVSSSTPGIGLEDTHLNARMGLLTLIIIGESVISVTRIVNKMVAGGGWTVWSFVHILGVTSTVYLVWQSYYDISPRGRLGKIRQQIWTQLHFPFHVSLILSCEGSQILALTLDIALKLRYLMETLMFACENPVPPRDVALALINNTIADMEIDYRGVPEEKKAIDLILYTLWNHKTLCRRNGTGTDSSQYGLTKGLQTQLIGNVTVSLFSSMEIAPSPGGLGHNSVRETLQTYVSLLVFVYVYYFVAISLVMVHFAAFTYLTRRQSGPIHNGISIATRLMLAVILLGMVAAARRFNLTYHYMTSPVIIFTFALILVPVLLVDRLLDRLVAPKSNLTQHDSRSSNAPMVGTEPGNYRASFASRDEEEGL